MNPTIRNLFDRYLEHTRDPQAAATLVLAHVGSGAKDEVLTTDQAAERLGVTRATVQAMVLRGDLQSMRAGRRIKIRSSWIDDFAQKQARPRSRHFG
ncbi:Helix-turn-helix domain protein [Caulifigura coniformis]|uniref:Helix-turn-helix domain protein n=1 Tax=Caulifigura coniformis TaxID=2527983 RepID=A0A517SBW0_9PLAN|nr:helix-turn-helix domain-containing protein [Caulifigura coniformis]QDT53594.1 Helix-turn-helix domain protein [Caulifigura coniformis]